MLFLQHSLRIAPAMVAVLSAPVIQAQQSVARPAPISYVASVRPNNAVDARTLIEYLPGGRLSATAVTVGALLRIAYRTQDYRIVGQPDWLSTSRYDISAKVDDTPPPTQQVLLRALLADRFHLAVHNETREQPIFALVPARNDEKPGPQLIKSDFDCDAYFAAPHGPPELGRTPPCATRIGPGALSGKSIPLSQLATSLSPLVSRFTIDKTGVTGRFDVDLTWTPDPVSPNTAADSQGPSIFTALQEQLGLKLVSERGPVEVLVVDRVERPSGN